MARYLLGEGARRKLDALFRRGGVDRRALGGAAVVDGGDYLPPFTVQFAASLAQAESSEGADDATSGEWIIWLPGNGLCMVGPTAVNVASGLQAAGGDYPTGWYKLGDALDPDDGGTLWLNVTVGSTVSAEFSDSAGSAGGPIPVKIAEASVDSTSGARSVKQFVCSAIVLGGGGEDRDTITYADEVSTSRAYGGNGSEGQQHSNILSIYGFGRFHDTSSNVRGFFSPSSEVEISEYDATSGAFLARFGNVDQVGANTLGYRNIRLKRIAEPFKFSEVLDVDPDSGDVVASRWLKNCQFFFNGELHTLPDVAVAANTTYYLNIVGTSDSTTHDISWTYSVDAAAAQMGDVIYSVPLYRIGNNFRPEMDFRAATLSFGAPNKTFTFNEQFVAHVCADDDIDIGTKEIVGGPGVAVSDDGETVTISVDVSLAAGPGVVISGGEVAVNPDGKSIGILAGSGNARKVQLLGFDSPATNATSDTLGEALAQANPSSTRYVVMAVPASGGFAIKYMPLGQIAVDADSHSGLSFVAVVENNAPVLRLDWDGRASGDTIALRELVVYGSDGTAQATIKVPASANVAVPGVKAGRGVSVVSDDNGHTMRIDATVADVQSDSTEIGVTRDGNGVVHLSFNGSGGGQSSAGYTGSMKVCSGLSYSPSTHKLIAQFQTYQVNNGLVMPNPTASSEDVFTAVEETV